MRSVESLIIYILMGSFCRKHIKFLMENTEELALMTLMSDKKFEEKMAFSSKNDMTNLIDFNMSSGKSENLHFNVLFLLIEYKISAKKVQKVISHDTVARPKL